MLEGEGDGPGLKQLVEQVVKTTGLTEAADNGKFLTPNKKTQKTVRGRPLNHLKNPVFVMRTI